MGAPFTIFKGKSRGVFRVGARQQSNRKRQRKKEKEIYISYIVKL